MFKVADAAILDLLKLRNFIGYWGRESRRISMPNFVKIDQSVAKIWRFFDFQDGGGRHLGLSNSQNCIGCRFLEGPYASLYQISSKLVVFVFSKRLMRLQRNLAHCKGHQILVVGRPENLPHKSKMADGRHLEKIDKLLYFSNGSTDFYEILYADAILKIVKCDISVTVLPVLVKLGTGMHIRPPNMMVNRKFNNFKIQDGGLRPSWK